VCGYQSIHDTNKLLVPSGIGTRSSALLARVSAPSLVRSRVWADLVRVMESLSTAINTPYIYMRLVGC
jgi:hypothetical protein